SEKKTLDRELVRAKVTANRVAVVVANEWKDANDKVMPVKQCHVLVFGYSASAVIKHAKGFSSSSRVGSRSLNRSKSISNVTGSNPLISKTDVVGDSEEQCDMKGRPYWEIK
ncbi:Microtubule-associated protein 70-2, partial [Nymphaea thermarum]